MPGAVATRRSSERSMSGTTSIASVGQPAYFSRRAISGARVPAQTTRRTWPAKSSKSASQIQETSRPSAMRSLSAIQRSRPPSSPASSFSVRRTSLAPAGFLISRIETGTPATSIVSTRPKAACISPRAVTIRSGATPRLRPGRHRREGVVDVVEAGQRQLQPELAGGAANRRPGSPPSRVARSSSRRRPGAAARRRSWDTRSGPGGRRRRARRRRGGRSGGSAWRRRRAAALAAPERCRRCRSRRRPSRRALLGVAAEVGDQRVVGVEGEARCVPLRAATVFAHSSASASISP